MSNRLDQVDWAAFTPDDWADLSHQAQVEGVAPLLYWVFRRLTQSIPQAVQQTLAREYYLTAARNVILMAELDRILAGLSTAGVPVIVLKGAALALNFYPDPGLRPMGDIDLLVPEAQLDIAIGVVRKFGYDVDGEEIQAGLSKLISYEKNLYKEKNNPIYLELHWNLIGGLSNRYRPDIQWFWRQTSPFAQSTSLDLVPHARHSALLLELDPTANLMYLTAHMIMKHGENQSRLIWAYDIHLLLRRAAEQIDWPEIVARASDFHWSSGIYQALVKVAACFATPMPSGIMELLGKHTRPIDDFYLRGKVEAKTRLEQTLHEMSLFNFRTRLRLMLALIFPSPNYIRWRYHPMPSWKWPVYYLYRWMDFINDGIAAWRLRKER